MPNPRESLTNWRIRDGLYLLVNPNGGKYWRYKYRYAGKERLLSLGGYPDLGLGDAREKLGAARKLLASGEDPGHAKREAKRQLLLKSGNTFEAVTKEWHKGRLHYWSPTHAKKIMNSFEADVFPRIGSRPIANITAADLLSMLRKIEGRGAHETAHRVSQNCGKVFSYAVVTQRVEHNPVPDLRGALVPVQKTHNAYLKEDELPEYLQRLAVYDGGKQTMLALKLLLLTFVRTNELRGARWSEINWNKAEWRIPAERMKMREPHIVPLSKQAMATLRELSGISGEWEFVFPNQQKPSGCMSENTLLYALYRMGYHTRATGHGFRSTASTILNEHGFPPDVIERQLAHCERNQVRAAYNHAQYLPERRKMMQWWADFLDGPCPKRQAGIIRTDLPSPFSSFAAIDGNRERV
ncbi:MAG: tyrosine-type recombinase/integrase [Limisphaerales bacterium]